MTDLTPPTRAALGDELVALTERLDALNGNVEGLRSDVQGLAPRTEVHETVARQAGEAVYRRRRSIVGVVLLLFVAVQTADVHVEACGPGHRVEHVLDAILAGRVESMEDLRAEAIEDDLAFCEATFPTHSHGADEWPTAWNLIGAGTYLAVAAFLVWHLRRPIVVRIDGTAPAGSPGRVPPIIVEREEPAP